MYVSQYVSQYEYLTYFYVKLPRSFERWASGAITRTN